MRPGSIYSMVRGAGVACLAIKPHHQRGGNTILGKSSKGLEPSEKTEKEHINETIR
jgi:hypothetical protein